MSATFFAGACCGLCVPQSASRTPSPVDVVLHTIISPPTFGFHPQSAAFPWSALCTAYRSERHHVCTSGPTIGSPKPQKEHKHDRCAWLAAQHGIMASMLSTSGPKMVDKLSSSFGRLNPFGRSSSSGPLPPNEPPATQVPASPASPFKFQTLHPANPRPSSSHEQCHCCIGVMQT